jgi:hypothetical protein
MSDDKNFLERWSRRKRAASDEPGEQSAERAADARTDAFDGKNDPSRPSDPKLPSPEATFDMASLPPLESITAASDMRAFLAPGVPQDLARAALRRAWSADPAIRDYIGLSEYAWDFNAPGGMAGFEPLRATDDIKKLLADVFGDDRSATEKAAALEKLPPPDGETRTTPAEPTNSTPKVSSTDRESHRGPQESSFAAAPLQNQADTVQREPDAAMQNSHHGQPLEPAMGRRRHGGALPKV